MSHRLLACLAISSGITLAACTDQQQDPSAPQFVSVLPASNVCDFNAFSSLISSYFSPPQKQIVQALEQQMEAAGANTPTARDKGYDIMVEIGKASRSAAPPPSVGADLTVGLIRCMFDATDADEFPAFPDPTVYNFEGALTFATGGGYWVRGGSSDPLTEPALGKIGSSNVSGMGPPAFPTTPISYKWDNTTSPPAARDGILDERVLIYGHPVTGGYDWAMIRPNVTFNPFAVVALCNVDASTFTMVQESDVGALPFDETTANSICSAPLSVSLLERDHGPFALLARLTRAGAGLLHPQPLYSATALAISSVGGTKIGGKSKYSTLEVENVASSWATAPPAKVKVNTPFTVKIKATTREGNKTIPALGVCYRVIGGANNGTPQQPQLVGTHTCGDGTFPTAVTTLVAGEAIATLEVSATQTGTLVISASGVVLARDGIVASLTARTKVIP